MIELKARHIVDVYDSYYAENPFGERSQVYLKSEADKVIAEKDAEICRLKNGIAPKYSDKTLQERLNEICEKHGVSTLQDLDWAFCESEKRRTRDSIESSNMIAELKDKLKVQTLNAEEGWKEFRAYYISYGEAVKELYEKNKQLRHHKYKRCLAMAWWCSAELGMLISTWESKIKYYKRWQRRWLELAEKFKEAK